MLRLLFLFSFNLLLSDLNASLAHDFRIMNNESGWLCVPVSDIGLVLPLPLVALARSAHIEVRRIFFFSFSSSKIPNTSIRPLILQGTYCIAFFSWVAGIRFNAQAAKTMKLIDVAVPNRELLHRVHLLYFSHDSISFSFVFRLWRWRPLCFQKDGIARPLEVWRSRFIALRYSYSREKMESLKDYHFAMRSFRNITFGSFFILLLEG